MTVAVAWKSFITDTYKLISIQVMLLNDVTAFVMEI